MIYKITSLLFVNLFIILFCANQQKQIDEKISQELPNNDLMLADDLGYGDIQKYNPTSRIPISNLKYLAESGMCIIDAHTNSVVCSSYHYGILTRGYAWRTRLHHGVLSEPINKPLIKPNQHTMADITGYSIIKNEGYDNFRFLPILLNEKTEVVRAPVILHSGNGSFAIREGKWEMFFSNGSGGREVPIGTSWKNPYSLINLEIDPSKSMNLIDKNPEVGKRIIERMDKIRNN